MPDSSDIDNAIVALLGGDATLLGYLPNGAYLDEAPPGATRFAIVSLLDSEDVLQFGGRATESGLYLVKAVGLSTTSPNMKAAAARVDALLEGATLTVSGYTTMTVHRVSRVRTTEVDDDDAALRWYHRGGLYRVMMST